MKNSAILATVAKPPAWTRLEPQSISGDPQPGIEARLHDPLWLIGRQWQLGEFRGEDCGTPVSVRLLAKTQALSALRPGGPEKGADSIAINPASVFEPLIEAEPWALPALRDRAEAGQALVMTLVEVGWNKVANLLAECGFDLAAADIVAQQPDESWAMIARHVPDGESAALALEDANPPAWLNGEPANVSNAASEWLGWYRRNVSRRDRAADSWHADRLEYRFALQAGEGHEARVMEAPCHLGGPIEWYSVDFAKGAAMANTAPAPVTEHKVNVHATGLRYAGMPSNRLWQFEDGMVNFGLTDVQPNDLARLVFLEYATIFGNDWLVAPIDLPRGVLASVTSVSYTTTFGETIDVAMANDQTRRGHFALYATDGPNGPEQSFVIPPNPRISLEAEAREEVVFARDETANVVWAVEKSVEGADGLGWDRASKAPPVAAHARPGPGAEIAWTLESFPPDYWVPMVPIPKGGNGGFFLRKGTFDGNDNSRGRLLDPTPFDLFDEEVPREGVRLRRVPFLLRDEHGNINRWIARRVSTAWGEGHSRLAYDVTEGPIN